MIPNHMVRTSSTGISFAGLFPGALIVEPGLAFLERDVRCHGVFAGHTYPAGGLLPEMRNIIFGR